MRPYNPLVATHLSDAETGLRIEVIDAFGEDSDREPILQEIIRLSYDLERSGDEVVKCAIKYRHEAFVELREFNAKED